MITENDQVILKMLAACSLLNHVELAKAFKDWPIDFSMVIA